MQTSAQGQITEILQDLENNRPSAAERLFPLVYDELHALAEGLFRHERSGHTLQPTALVHEAYMRLVNQTQIGVKGRGYFFAAAAQAMRRVLIGHAEQRRTLKRGGGWQRVTLCDDTPQPDSTVEVDLLALDRALGDLEALDQRQCRIVELRFFSGLSVQDAAEALGISTRTVELDWQMARAWLYKQLKE